MAGQLSRFPREKLFEARAERIFPFLEQVYLEMKIDPPVHRLFAYDRDLNPVHFSWALADFKEARMADSMAFFSETSKMNCLSWSLPAGNPNVLGTCFMEGGQAKSYICRSCYAGKGNYIQNPIVQAAQATRLKWAEQALAAGNFVDQMSTAFDYSFNPKYSSLSEFGADANKFFRLHDSGDFYDPDYLSGWFEVIRNFPRIHFWAPTRMWARPEFKDWIEAAGGIPGNLALRPSGLHFNKKAPEVSGMAAGSTAHDHHFPMTKKTPIPVGHKGGMFIEIQTEKHWECPAYRNESNSCLGSIDLGITAGSPYGCRMCWMGMAMPVSYKGH